MTINLTKLHEGFIDKARKPMTFGRLPILPLETEVPVIAVDKWVKGDGSMSKIFQFRTNAQRNEFIKETIEHEEEVGHHALLTVEDGKVSVVLQTHGVDRVTELDKEFAKWLDELFKDVVYCVKYAR